MIIIILGTDSKPTKEYKYLDGRCRHYKLIGEFDNLPINRNLLYYCCRGGSWDWTKSPCCSASDEGDDPWGKLSSG